ncbi:alpha/beta fold hydrolase [Cellulomonas sp. ATA003]|uniref:alpha/beta fold hydrolase n=1 Tax=Cellulomonas sp. ATA003 TaxID=3073064 RepID=UPI002872B2B2|nr:alpha/beta fold hydrolase [Cellulomonas sp. ATA003]WNB84366.1 alpha/beta fold hydrolase [Cellulomonas sp. ATA003]
MRTSTVPAGGYDLAVTRAGDPGAPPFVLVHGIGMSGRYFRPLVDVLARGSHVLAVDLPGFGASGRPGPALDVPALADVVAALLDRLAADGVPAPVLVGHSMGCQVVTEVLAAHPGVATGGVLIGPVVDDDARSAVRQGLRLLRDARHEPMRVNALITADYLRAGPRRYLATLPHMLGYRIHERIAQVTDPVLVVRGANDPIAPSSWVRRLADSAPRGTATEVPDAGHVAMYSHPEAVSGLCHGVTC